MLETHAALCGRALAHAHARTGDPVAVAAFLRTKERVPAAVMAFAEGCVEVVRDDYDAYVHELGDRAPIGDSRVDLPALGD